MIGAHCFFDFRDLFGMKGVLRKSRWLLPKVN